MRKPFSKTSIPPTRFLAWAAVLLFSISLALGAKVKEVVVRFDDGSEQTVPANTAPGPQPAPDPVPVPDPDPAPVPVPDPAPAPGDETLGVQLVDPADSTVTCAPGYLLLRAKVTGNVSKVEFFQGDLLIGASDAKPHMIAWRDIAAGTYMVTAKATDAAGATVVSPAARVVVKDPPVGKTLTAASSGDVSRVAPQLLPGDTLLIKSGTYTESIRLARSGLPDRPISIRAEEPGKVTIQAPAAGSLLNGDAADYIIISGITFTGGGADKQDNDKAAVRVGSYCRVEDCTIQNALGVGLTMKGTGSVFLRVTAQDNARAGLGGTSNKSAMMIDCISRRNNSKGDSNGGGGKFTRSDGVLIQNHQSYENTGVGIWFDYSNIDCVVRHCEVHNNVDRMKNGKLKSGAAGIFFEISGIVEKSGKEGYFLAEDNYVHDNDREGIQVWGSRNVIIQNNTLVNDSIELRAGRPAPFQLKNVLVSGNRLKDTSIGLDGDAAKQFANAQIRIDGNTYDRLGGAMVRWGGTNYKSLPEVRDSLGIEAHGVTQSIELPDWTTRP